MLKKVAPNSSVEIYFDTTTARGWGLYAVIKNGGKMVPKGGKKRPFLLGAHTDSDGDAAGSDSVGIRGRGDVLGQKA